MKKLLLATLLAVGGMMSASAQGLYLTSYGEEIPNGSTLNYTTYDWEIFAPDFSVLTINPRVDLVTERDGTVTIHTSSNLIIGLCAGSLCERKTDITKDNVQMKAGTPLNIMLDWEQEFYEEIEEFEIPAISVLIEVWYNDNPDDKYVITWNFGGFKAFAGVESIGGDLNSINFHGNTLSYDLAQTSQLSVYSLSGKTVINKTVAGNGEVSLNGLSKGIYLYRVTGKNGKLVKTAKIIIK